MSTAKQTQPVPHPFIVGSRLRSFSLIEDWTVPVGRGPRDCRSARLLEVAVAELASGETPVIDDADLEHAVCADDNDLHGFTPPSAATLPHNPPGDGRLCPSSLSRG